MGLRVREMKGQHTYCSILSDTYRVPYLPRHRIRTIRDDSGQEDVKKLISWSFRDFILGVWEFRGQTGLPLSPNAHP
jgi:hypothetical protein